MGPPSSLWPGIRRHLGRLIDGSRWFMGQSSGISFWNDNWLGYIISEIIGIPHFFAIGLTNTTSDYFFDRHWHFDYDFFMKHTDIVRDILSIHVSRGDDSRVRGRSVSGQLTSWMAYDFFVLLTLGLAGLLGFGGSLYPLVVLPSIGIYSPCYSFRV
ncbi:hypothetical protein ACS0TY_018336 [Phlomoides rotata]